MLSCVGLGKRFGDRIAVDDVSFAIADGECYGLLGPNGAGKTTTISMVCGLLAPDRGTASIDGAPAGSLRAKAAVGYVPQDLALYPDLERDGEPALLRPALRGHRAAARLSHWRGARARRIGRAGR